MNVYDAAVARIERVFDAFDFVIVSFSGGKDSGVMMNIVLDIARRRGCLDRLGIFHIDYEAQYSATTDYVDMTLSELPESVKFWRICLPLRVPCATSMLQDSWYPWSPDARDIWVRDMPDHAITLDNPPAFFAQGMWDYDFQEKFAAWVARDLGYGSVASLVGIRSDESLNRWRAIHRADRIELFDGIRWSRRSAENVYNFYPIHDWSVTDIWAANGRFGWSYNKLYDLMHLAGLSPHEMRVASPFISQAVSTLHLYRTIEPDTWGKLISRVNGVNFAGIYGGTTAMGWKAISKPAGMTWKEYRDYLLGTLPDEIADRYKEKFATSERFWAERGGLLTERTIAEIRADDGDIETTADHSYRSDNAAVRFATYPDDLPSVTDFNVVPSYKRMCVCIMKNDHFCKYMGFTQDKRAREKRADVLARYQEIL